MGQLLSFVPEVPVFIVDDDPSVREALVLLLKIEGYAPQCFGDGASFLDAVQSVSPACVILDLHLPGASGFDILRKLAAERLAAPILVISGVADIATAVEAMKHGALDFLEKPFSSEKIVERVRAAVKVWREVRGGEIDGLANFPGRHLLTCREREVLSQVARGASNKEAGRRLGISPRTVEVHRARIMDKLGAKNAADLIRIVLSEASARRRLSAS
ncbi:MAG: DNA-binding response regulator [Nitrobacter sp. 62-13]|jgi:FixJ family two-component response regulator|uniref:response regulator transcription factor n=1 Tax=Nitrobacter sp. 62-13 TaxID=1895797 RepID=UPI000959FCC9|nr:response regulator [Nitrobacter sp. 62-13]OJU24980.1 MAG: DNA-binding response regulator [Nitrobacter sp. 62-13]